jgi:formylglycine-generating enzyme required for sulfatase activity
MGAGADDPDASDFELPRHAVRIAYPLAIGRFPVTFEEYDHFCSSVGIPAAGDEGWGRARRPAIKVSWHDALDYLA